MGLFTQSAGGCHQGTYEFSIMDIVISIKEEKEPHQLVQV